MKRTQKLVWAAAVLGASTALLVACGGGHDDGGAAAPQASVTSEVPPQAATSPSVATSYVAELAAVPASTTDTLEPVVVPEMLASDDNGEPAIVN